MRLRITIVFILLLFGCTTVVSQPCLPDGITFTTQSQIDSFPINYPGCTEIEGNVEVNGADISNFNGLNAITQIGGELLIGTYFYGGNLVLENLSGLENLTYVAGDVSILRNFELTSLTGLENLTSTGGRLAISDNPLNSFAGLDNLTSIGGRLVVNRMNTITDLSGLESITSVGDRVSITENDSLTSLTGLDNLTSIGGRIEISANKALVSLKGIDNIAAGTVEDLSIYNNIALSNCHVQCICDYLSSPNGTVTIYNNATGCNNPAEIADSCGFTIPCLPFGDYYLHSQTDIDSFQTNYPGCTTLKGHVHVHGDDIANLNGLNVITSFEDKLWIVLNPALKNLSGLDNVTYVGDVLYISQNDSLINLTGLNNLDSIGQDFWISSNESLEDITALSSLNSIGNELSFVFNWDLLSLSGLENLDSASINILVIRNNYSLSDCAAQSICNYLASPNGYVEIHDNAPGCNSPEEVLHDCFVGIPELPEDVRISVYPNPTSSVITIAGVNGVINEVSIYNKLGQRVIHEMNPNNTVDVSWLPRGLYIVEVVLDGQQVREKVIVQ
jgi:hypothetical protein